MSIRQVIEAGPKIPSTDPAARARTKSRAASRSLSETKCTPFEADGDRFIPSVCAVYRNSASQSPLNVVALRDLLPLGTQRLSVSPYHTRTRLRFAETAGADVAPFAQETAHVERSGLSCSPSKAYCFDRTSSDPRNSRIETRGTLMTGARLKHYGWGREGEGMSCRGAEFCPRPLPCEICN